MKIDLKESLNELDIISDNKYDLYNTYLSKNPSVDVKKKLVEAIYKNGSPKEVSNILNEGHYEYGSYSNYEEPEDNRVEASGEEDITIHYNGDVEIYDADNFDFIKGNKYEDNFDDIAIDPPHESDSYGYIYSSEFSDVKVLSKDDLIDDLIPEAIYGNMPEQPGVYRYSIDAVVTVDWSGLQYPEDDDYVFIEDSGEYDIVDSKILNCSVTEVDNESLKNEAWDDAAWHDTADQEQVDQPDYFPDGEEELEWEEMNSKSVRDSDGFLTDYTWYRNNETGQNVFVFGDKDLYRPEDGSFDWECDTDMEGFEWFKNYTGPGDDEDDWMDESLKGKVYTESANDYPINKDQLIAAMEAAGYTLDTFESTDDYLRFYGTYGNVMTMDSWDECEEWLNGVVFDDPQVSDRVEAILHPERFDESLKESKRKAKKFDSLKDAKKFLNSLPKEAEGRMDYFDTEEDGAVKEWWEVNYYLNESLKESNKTPKWKITYGKGRPSGEEEVVEFPTYKEAKKYAADHAKGWGFEVKKIEESLDEALYDDIYHDFRVARENWKKLNLNIDFDSALDKWNKSSELAEPDTWYSKPLYSKEAWDDMVSMFSSIDESLDESSEFESIEYICFEDNKIALKTENKDEAISFAKNNPEIDQVLKVTYNDPLAKAYNTNPSNVDVIYDRMDESLNEKMVKVEPSDKELDQVINVLNKYGFKLDDNYKPGRGLFGSYHIQVINPDLTYIDDDQFVKAIEPLADDLDSLSTTINMPVTYNFGANEDGIVTAGVDIHVGYKDDSDLDESLTEDLAYVLQKLHDEDDNLWNLHGTDYTWLYIELDKYGNIHEEEIADIVRKMPKSKQYELFDKLVEPLHESLNEEKSDDEFITKKDVEAAKLIIKKSTNPKEIKKAQCVIKKYKDQNKNESLTEDWRDFCDDVQRRIIEELKRKGLSTEALQELDVYVKPAGSGFKATIQLPRRISNGRKLEQFFYRRDVDRAIRSIVDRQSIYDLIEIQQDLLKPRSVPSTARLAIEARDSTDPNRLRELSKHNAATVRKAVAKNHKTPVDVLLDLYEDEDKKVSETIYQYQFLFIPDHLIYDRFPDDPDVLCRLASIGTDQDILRDVYDKADTTSNPNYSYWCLAKNKNTPDDVLLDLAKQNNQDIDWALSFRSNLPEGVVSVLRSRYSNSSNRDGDAILNHLARYR